MEGIAGSFLWWILFRIVVKRKRGGRAPGASLIGCHGRPETALSRGFRHACPEPSVRQEPRLGRRDDPAGPRLLQASVPPAGPAVPLDRLLGQPGAGQPDRGPAPRRDVRPP